MPNPVVTRYRFGPFTLVPGQGTLVREDEPIAISPKRLAILELLITNAGAVVRKEEIFRAVWPGQEVEDAALTLHIFNLRRLLGDTTQNPHFILTVPGVGYIFVEQVIVSSSDAVETGPSVEQKMAGWRVPDRAGRPNRSTALAVLKAVIVTGGVLLGILAGQSIWNRHRSAASPRLTRLTSLPGIERQPAFSPDGAWIAFTSDDEASGHGEIYVKSLESGAIQRLTDNSAIDHHPIWSPDGRWIAFVRDSGQHGARGRVIVMPAAGGAEQEIGVANGGIDWAPDGRHLAISDSVAPNREVCLFLITPDGRERRQITHPRSGRFLHDLYPRFSPDGRRIAFLRYTSDESSLSEIFTLDLTNGNLRQITDDHQRITDLEWGAPDDEIVFASNRDGERRLWRVAGDGGAPRLVTGLESRIESFSLSPDGKRLAFTQSLQDTITAILPLEESGNGDAGSPVPCFINSSQADDSPRFSPDGQRVAFISNRSGWDEIWVAGRDCSEVRQLTSFQELGVGSPRWSPDGAKIIFDRRPADRPEVWVLNLADLSTHRIPAIGHSDLLPNWSIDGRSILLQSNRGGLFQIWKVGLAGEDPVQLTRQGGRESTLAADGASLFYTNDDYLWQQDLRTGMEAPLAALKETPVGRYWDLVGNRLYFIPKKSRVHPIIHSLDPATGQIRRLAAVDGFLARWTPGLSVSPDGRLVAVSYINYRRGDLTLVEDWR